MKVFEIVAVYDNLAEAYLEPRFFGSLAEAERVFQFQINDIPLWKANAGDYDLYSLGRYDSETGQLMSELHKIVNGRSVLRKESIEDDIRSDQKA
jgi:hypothetical protein